MPSLGREIIALTFLVDCFLLEEKNLNVLSFKKGKGTSGDQRRINDASDGDRMVKAWRVGKCFSVQATANGLHSVPTKWWLLHWGKQMKIG